MSGLITTARGEILNLDMLIEQAKRPIGFKDENSEVKQRTIPDSRKLNVRAFIPAQGNVTVPTTIELEEEKSVTKPAVKKRVGKKTLAEQTQVRVEKKEDSEKLEDASGKANEKLGEILGDLKKENPNSVKAAAKMDKEEPAK